MTRLRRALRGQSAVSKSIANIQQSFEKKYGATRHRVGRIGLARVFASCEPRRMEAVFGGGFVQYERVCEPRLSYPVVITFCFLTQSVGPAPFVKPERTTTLLGCAYISHVDNVARISATCVNWRHCWLCSQGGCRAHRRRSALCQTASGGGGHRASRHLMPPTASPATHSRWIRNPEQPHRLHECCLFFV